MDAATGGASAAVWCDGTVAACESQALNRGQAEALLPMVARVMATAGLDFADLDRLAVTVGPGHFTGLRAALAAARGLALATGLPLVGIGTLRAVAAAVPAAERRGRRLVVALDSKRREAYLQTFTDTLTPEAPPVAALAAAYAGGLPTDRPCLVAGDAAGPMIEALAGRGLDAIRAAPLRPEAGIIAALAAGENVTGTLPAPVYLHPVEARLPVAAGR